MRDADGLSASRRRVTAIIVSFTAAVFVLDLLTPLGIPYWLLYGVPFFFIRYNTPRHFAYLLAAICTILMMVGYALSSAGGKAEPLTQRASAALILWVVTIALARRRA
jgi:hypothetical protein